MTAHICPLADLRRPALLVHAGGILANTLTGDAARASIATLMAREEACEALRRAGGGGYSPLDHVDALGRLIRAARALKAQRNASGSSDLRRAM